MSTLEKAIGLLQTMPEQKIETVYTFIQFINSQELEKKGIEPANKKSAKSILGIASEYANPALIEQEEGAFKRAITKKYATD